MCGAEGQELLFYLPELFLVVIQAEDKARNAIRSNYFGINQFGIFDKVSIIFEKSSLCL